MFIKEDAHFVCDFGTVRLNGEVPGVEKFDLCLWIVTLERFCSRRLEERVILAPDYERGRLVFPEKCMQLCILFDVRAVVPGPPTQAGLAWEGDALKSVLDSHAVRARAVLERRYAPLDPATSPALLRSGTRHGC